MAPFLRLLRSLSCSSRLQAFLSLSTQVCVTFVFSALLEYALVNYASRSDAARLAKKKHQKQWELDHMNQFDAPPGVGGGPADGGDGVPPGHPGARMGGGPAANNGGSGSGIFPMVRKPFPNDVSEDAHLPSPSFLCASIPAAHFRYPFTLFKEEKILDPTEQEFLHPTNPLQGAEMSRVKARFMDAKGNARLRHLFWPLFLGW